MSITGSSSGDAWKPSPLSDASTSSPWSVGGPRAGESGGGTRERAGRGTQTVRARRRRSLPVAWTCGRGRAGSNVSVASRPSSAAGGTRRRLTARRRMGSASCLTLPAPTTCRVPNRSRAGKSGSLRRRPRRGLSVSQEASPLPPDCRRRRKRRSPTTAMPLPMPSKPSVSGSGTITSWP